MSDRARHHWRCSQETEIPGCDSRLPVLVIGADNDHDHDAIRHYHAADIVLARTSSPLVIAAALEALARRTGSEQRRRVVRGVPGRDGAESNAKPVAFGERLGPGRPAGARGVLASTRLREGVDPTADESPDG